MLTTVVTPPAPFVDPTDVVSRLNLSSTADTAVIDAYIAAATANLDGPAGIMGRALGLQTLMLQMEHFPGRREFWHPHSEELSHRRRGERERILLSYPEIVSVTSIAYIDTNGDAQTLDPSTYIVLGRRIVPAPYNCWPMTQFRPDAVTIEYQAGYQPGSEPPNLIQAIVLMVATMLASGRSTINLKQETVVGVSSLQWDTTSAANDAYERAINCLLAPLMVYSRDA